MSEYFKKASTTKKTIRPKIITLEGNIGAGKSTYLEKIKLQYADRDDILFLQEPVDTWSKITQDGKTVLELFYENQEKYSFPFQILAFHTRYELLKNAIEEAVKGGRIKTIIMERSLEADRNIFAKMLYDENKIEPCMYKIYQQMSDDGLKTMGADSIWWINTKPEECLRRIAKRNRIGEDKIPLAYLEKCHKYHCDWLMNNPKVILVD